MAQTLKVVDGVKVDEGIAEEVSEGDSANVGGRVRDQVSRETGVVKRRRARRGRQPQRPLRPPDWKHGHEGLHRSDYLWESSWREREWSEK